MGIFGQLALLRFCFGNGVIVVKMDMLLIPHTPRRAGARRGVWGEVVLGGRLPRALPQAGMFWPFGPFRVSLRDGYFNDKLEACPTLGGK